MNIKIGDKVLVTVDQWFYTPSGNSCNAVFGTVKSIENAEKVLGIKPNSRSTNWYLEVGNMIIAGCQIHYIIKTNNCHSGKFKTWSASAEAGLKEYEIDNPVFFAD